MDPIVKWLKQELLAYIDSGVSDDDCEHAVSVSHCNILRWFDALDRLSAQQREPVVRVKELEWRPSYLASWNGDYHTVPTAYTVRCADENGWKWSGFGGNGWEPSPESAKSAAQADYEQRIRSAIEIAPQSDRQPLPGRKQVSETGKELPENAEQPMNNADVSVGELAGFFVTEFPHLLTMLTQIEVARALLASFKIERLGCLPSGRR